MHLQVSPSLPPLHLSLYFGNFHMHHHFCASKLFTVCLMNYLKNKKQKKTDRMHNASAMILQGHVMLQVRLPRRQNIVILYSGSDGKSCIWFPWLHTNI